MRILICAVGRSRKGAARDLYQEYVRLIRWSVELAEVELRKNAPVDARVRAEGELLLEKVPDGAVVVALEETGKALTSRALARRIGSWRDDGYPSIVFVIGGADGLSDAVRSRADLVLSFGRMTWPHLMVRGMLAEQIYRAQQILAGHPYHRD